MCNLHTKLKRSITVRESGVSAQKCIIESIFTWFSIGGQTYEITLFGDVDNGTKGSSKLRVKINKPPVNGTCVATPAEGKPMDPIFSLSCTGFQDEDGPFNYEFSYSTNTEGEEIPLGSGLDSSRSKVTLPSGTEENAYNIKIMARVSDSLGASTKVTFSDPVKVSSLLTGTGKALPYNSHITVTRMPIRKSSEKL